MGGERGEGEGVFLEWVCVSGFGELGECGDGGGGEGESEGGFDGDLVCRALFFAPLIIVRFVGISLRGWVVVLLTKLMFGRWCRFLGTSCLTALCEWKYWHYPEDYAWMGTPVDTFLFVATAIGDMIYPFVFYLVERIETGPPIPAHHPILYLSALLLDICARVWSFITSHPSNVAGAVIVAVTWYILTAILWRLDNISKLLEAQGLRKPWNLEEVQQKGEEQLGTWTEKDVDTGTLDEGLRQTIVRQKKKPRIIEVKRRESLDGKVDDRAGHRPATL